jgi:hypothetical protein
MARPRPIALAARVGAQEHDLCEVLGGARVEHARAYRFVHARRDASVERPVRHLVAGGVPFHQRGERGALV